MIDKVSPSLEEAMSGISDGAVIMIGGFGPSGQPTTLIDALVAQGSKKSHSYQQQRG